MQYSYANQIGIIEADQKKNSMNLKDLISRSKEMSSTYTLEWNGHRFSTAFAGLSFREMESGYEILKYSGKHGKSWIISRIRPNLTQYFVDLDPFFFFQNWTF